MSKPQSISDQEIAELLESSVNLEGGERTLAGLRGITPKAYIEDGVLYFGDGDGDSIEFYDVPFDLENLRKGIKALCNKAENEMLNGDKAD